MIAGLATHIGVNDHYILTGYGRLTGLRLQERQLATVIRKRGEQALRKRDEVGEILAPRVFHSVWQDDNAFRR
jgi:hypothetical protein